MRYFVRSEASPCVAIQGVYFTIPELSEPSNVAFQVVIEEMVTDEREPRIDAFACCCGRFPLEGSHGDSYIHSSKNIN